jgi:V-type H+-transporting ATPase subunit C
LDSLVLLSDEVHKFDTLAEASTNKLVDIMKNLLNQDTKQVESTLLVSERMLLFDCLIVRSSLCSLNLNDLRIQLGTPDAFIRSFSWNAMKYRVDKPLREIAEAIQQVCPFKCFC